MRLSSRQQQYDAPLKDGKLRDEPKAMSCRGVEAVGACVASYRRKCCGVDGQGETQAEAQGADRDSGRQRHLMVQSRDVEKRGYRKRKNKWKSGLKETDIQQCREAPFKNGIWVES